MEIRDALQGHTSGRTGANYGRGFSIEALRDAINKVSYGQEDNGNT